MDVVAFALDDDGQVSCDEDFVFYSAAAIYGEVTFGELGPIELVAGPGDGEQVIAQATLDAGTAERTMLLAGIYRRGPRWRLRVVGQGHDFGLDGLDELARGLGVGVGVGVGVEEVEE